MLNEKIKRDIEEAGGKLLGKPEGLIINFIFKSASAAKDSYLKLTKKYSAADFFASGRRLLVYGITDQNR